VSLLTSCVRLPDNKAFTTRRQLGADGFNPHILQLISTCLDIILGIIPHYNTSCAVLPNGTDRAEVVLYFRYSIMMILSNGDPPDVFEQSFSRRTSSLAQLTCNLDLIGQLPRSGCGRRVHRSLIHLHIHGRICSSCGYNVPLLRCTSMRSNGRDIIHLTISISRHHCS
jgi:hypothetical protein